MSRPGFFRRANNPLSDADQSGDPPPNDAHPAVLNKTVFFTSSSIILALAIWAMAAPTMAEEVIGTVVSWISNGFGWYYFLAATIFLVFIVFIASSSFGKIRLGPEESKPEYSLFTWGSMLFAAGIGIDLMFFSVAEPVTQYLQPPEGAGETHAAARQAVTWTLFHYGITGWAMYALMGVALAYFAFRRNLPLTIRSALYPVIGKRINGRIGDAVDTAAVLGTIFGIATSLGIGVVQLNYGLNFMFGIAQGTATQIALIAVAVFMATASVVSGVDKGIRRLSELNVILAILLMLFILFAGDTVFLLNAIVLNVGDYISRFPGMTLDTFAFDRPTAWLNAWTLFFWAWWIAWAPFVGLFLARISRGRTIRQFVAGTMIIPFLFILVWISIFGNSALKVVMNGNTEFGESAMNAPETGFYSLLDQYPWVPVTAGIATITGLLFYVTSADSGSLVMANFTSKLKTPMTDAAPWLRIFWSAAIGLLTLSMLIVGGVPTLQNATIIMGLPFSFVMFLVMFGLYKSLRQESFKVQSFRGGLAASLSSRTGSEARGTTRNWRQRLQRLALYPGRAHTERFLAEVCAPALRDVSAEIRGTGGEAEYVEGVIEESGMAYLHLTVPFGEQQRFTYKIWPTEAPMPAFATRSQRGTDTYFRVEVYLNEGSQGYNVTGYTKDQIIGDVLDQYERHLHFLHLQRSDTEPSHPQETGTPDIVSDDT
ncbi:choline BCCT transporter BetT [Tomitella biformata]|uniref:choline BCCT transporter BetT n=1 Tax=Tomitella biformata TaxID=630403 RepID=UPI0004671C8B|nr:choline BCCT transporter BetT [Tomitella biformata]